MIPTPRTTSNRRLLAGLTALGLAGATAGCGGGAVSDGERVAQTIHTYVQAQATGDGQRACSQLGSRGQRQLITLTSKMSKGLLGTSISCEEAVSLIHGAAGTRLLRALVSARVANVKISGGRASAEVIDGTQLASQQVLLEKVGSTWKISEVPGLPG